ncbi:MAG: hypothetical protein GVY31_01085 [Alphaproteobacteria bacterium]|nr:hypothetical protein [Alphaproteobacteria bacterium]
MADQDRHAIAAAGRRIALVMVASALLSMFAPAIVDALGLAPRFAVLLTLFALAGFIWCLVVTFKLWQKTREK